MARVYLNGKDSGRFFLCSAKDLGIARSRLWYLDRHGYVYDGRRGGPNYFHHLVLGKPPGGLETSHRNMNALDNRRENLEFVSHSVNMHNTGLRCDNTSGSKGVGFSKAQNGWRARINVAGVEIYLGWFESRGEAVRARRAAEQELLPDTYAGTTG